VSAQSWLASWGRPQKRAVIPSLKAEIDAAIASTAHLPHYFWTGLLPPFRGREDSVEPRARDAARRLGGTTLEDTLAGINMPTWAEQDQDSQDTWVYASDAYAAAATGVTYVIRGEQVRPTNVFDTLVRLSVPRRSFFDLRSVSKEFPRLVANPAVTGIYQINIHLADEDQPFLLWPDQTPATAETLIVSFNRCRAIYWATSLRRNTMWPYPAPSIPAMVSGATNGPTQPPTSALGRVMDSFMEVKALQSTLEHSPTLLSRRLFRRDPRKRRWRVGSPRMQHSTPNFPHRRPGSLPPSITGTGGFRMLLLAREQYLLCVRFRCSLLKLEIRR
jgi:hypothetical protein